MAAKTVLNYLPRESVVHKMTGTTKLAFFLLFTFASMITYNTWVLLGLLVVSLLAFRLSRIKFREVRFMMTFMLVFLLLNNLFIFLFDPNQGTTLYGTRTVLCHLFWRYDVTAEQLFYMFNISLKYFVALPVAILGGALYHLIFEAKAQYAYPYMVYMLPLAAAGLCRLEDGAARLICSGKKWVQRRAECARTSHRD